eukprot:TRINITY_DN2382_c0_g1_i1.p1 TRINITY_DN2382_c0_g1~~TRINITY_DN2382_c0_g1_i1.p1  ORF type:complete len:118 (+),score=8.99 TRINITY_DN2382_c0_g1_i1:136-489(+)
MRVQHQDWPVVPSGKPIRRAFDGVMRRKGRSSLGPLSSCRIWADDSLRSGQLRLSGSPDMSKRRRTSDYSRWGKLSTEDLRAEALAHLLALQGISSYNLDAIKLNDLLCVKHQALPA